jgi:hypothetical protein
MLGSNNGAPAQGRARKRLGGRRRVTVSALAAAIAKVVDQQLQSFPNANHIEVAIWELGTPGARLDTRHTFDLRHE